MDQRISVNTNEARLSMQINTQSLVERLKLLSFEMRSMHLECLKTNLRGQEIER